MSTTNDGDATATTVPHRHPIDWDRRESVSFAIQAALSELEDCPPTDLTPLADHVDPDALEAFFSGPPADVSTRSFTFEYDDYTVRVDGGGHVLVD